MKGKMFLAHLNKAISSGQYKIKGHESAKVLSIEGNVLKCEHKGKEFDFCVDKIKASKQDVEALYCLCEEKKPKKEDKE